MNTQVPQLKALQDIDRQIFRWTKDRMAKPKALEGAEREVAAKKKDFDALSAEVKAARVEVDKRELDLKEKDERKKRLEAQRDQSKTNKEYQAYNFEIAAIRSESGKVEEDILRQMSAVEEVARKAEGAKGAASDAEGKLAELKKAVDAEIAKIDEELKGLRDRRGAAAAAVHPDYVKLYERILKAKPDSVALAPATEEKDGWHCGGCRMEITFQDLNTIMKGKDPVTCRSCSRILYLDKSPQPAPAK
jgi:hypothetical protein